MRYTLSLVDNQVKETELLNASIEFPRINENYNTLEYRYLYAVDPRVTLDSKDIRPIYKIDTKTNEKILWSEAGLMPGEPVFIANPKGDSEDDGVVVTIVLDNARLKAFLLILDGKALKEIARVEAPFPIPLGLHGQYFD